MKRVRALNHHVNEVISLALPKELQRFAYLAMADHNNFDSLLKSIAKMKGYSYFTSLELIDVADLCGLQDISKGWITSKWSHFDPSTSEQIEIRYKEHGSKGVNVIRRVI